MTLQDATDEQFEPTPEPETPTPTPERDGTRRLKTIIVILAAFSLALALLAAMLSAQNRDIEARRPAVHRAAAAMGSAMLHYDYRALPEAKARVLRLATGTFKKQYSEAFDGGFDELYKATEQVSKVREVKVWVGEVTDSEATAIVQVDFLVSGLGGKNRPRTAFLEFSLVHSDGGWLVDSVSTINAGNESTETTTVPG